MGMKREGEFSRFSWIRSKALASGEILSASAPCPSAPGARGQLRGGFRGHTQGAALLHAPEPPGKTGPGSGLAPAESTRPCARLLGGGRASSSTSPTAALQSARSEEGQWWVMQGRPGTAQITRWEWEWELGAGSWGLEFEGWGLEAGR